MPTVVLLSELTLVVFSMEFLGKCLESGVKYISCGKGMCRIYRHTCQACKACVCRTQ